MFGWVDSLRDHGDVLFIHLRDRSGIVQVVFSPEFTDKAICSLAAGLRNEFCINVSGQVVKRAEGTENTCIETGTLEVITTGMTILSKSSSLPFSISEKAMLAGTNNPVHQINIRGSIRGSTRSSTRGGIRGFEASVPLS